MAQEPIRLEFTLSEADMRAASVAERAGRFKKKRGTAVTVWYGIVLGLAIYLVWIKWGYIKTQLVNAHLWEQAWLWVVVLGLVVLALWWTRRTMGRRLLASNPRLRAPRVKVITGKGITTTVAGKADELLWRDVPRVVAGPDAYLVYRPNGMFDIIPARTMEAEERARFEKFAGTRLVKPAE